MTEPLSVGAAVARVMAELPAIGKDGRAAPSQGGYAYRGIEQITQHAQGLFAKHGVVIVPQVQSVDVQQITVANKPWTDTTLVVNYLVVGPDGSTMQATTVGIGRDNADKGANKAMTQAFKYLLLQLLCISDAKDDTDGQTHEADARPSAAEREARALVDRLRALPEPLRNELRPKLNGRAVSVAELTGDADWREQVAAWADEVEQAVAS